MGWKHLPEKQLSPNPSPSPQAASPVSPADPTPSLPGVPSWPHPSPKILRPQEAQVTVVDVEVEVMAVAVKGDDFALRVGSHAGEEDALIVLQAADPRLLLHLPRELHLHGRRGEARWRSRAGTEGKGVGSANSKKTEGQARAHSGDGPGRGMGSLPPQHTGLLTRMG